jgi:hypothetical protein
MSTKNRSQIYGFPIWIFFLFQTHLFGRTYIWKWTYICDWTVIWDRPYIWEWTYIWELIYIEFFFFFKQLSGGKPCA